MKLKDSLLSLPRELYHRSTRQALKPLVSTVVLASLAYFAASRLPWYYLPVVWVILGGLYVGLCAIALDCANNTFSRSRVVNELVGNVVSIPLLVPFNSWRVHLRTRNFEDVLHALAHGRSWWLASVDEWLRANFDMAAVWSKGHRRLILVSLISMWTAACVLLPMLVNFLGFSGLVKFWLIPWIVYHVWKSAFLQAAYRVPFTEREITVTIAFPDKYPAWVKLLSNDFAFLLSASRIFSHYLKEKSQQLIPNANLKAAFQLVGLKGGYVLDVKDALEEEREKRRIEGEQRDLDTWKHQLDFGSSVDSLPLMNWEEFKATGKAKRLVVCDGIVFDIHEFYGSHPGGQLILDRFSGHDITAVFNGGIYNHSNAARNLARRFMLARIDKRPL